MCDKHGLPEEVIGEIAGEDKNANRQNPEMDEFIRQLEPWFTAMDERRSSDEISKPRGDIDKMLKAALTKGDSRFFADVPDVEYTVAKKDL